MTDKTLRQKLDTANEHIRALETEQAALNTRLLELGRQNEKACAKLIQYEGIISSTPDLISLIDRKYQYRMVNNAYLENFSMTQEEFINQHVSSILGEELFQSIIKERLDRALAGETVKAQNWLNIPKLGRKFFATTYHPVTIGDGTEYVAMDCRDMTELKVKEEDLQATAHRLDMATDAGNIGIWERDLTTNKNYWDKKMYELYRVDPEEFDSIYEAWRTRVHHKDLPDVERKMVESIERKERIDSEFRIVWPDGEIRNIKIAATIQTDEDDIPVRMTGVTWDVTKHRRMENDLRKLASTDPLTGASNRRHFMERLNDELERCRRYNTPLVLLSLDIDHFKNINDTYGHPAGDDVLKDLVKLCTTTLRTTDVFGRVGGEEFLAALTLTGITAGQRTAERLRRIIEKHAVNTHGQSISFTISIGMTELKKTDNGIDPLLRRTDEALYKAKNNGRNRVETV